VTRAGPNCLVNTTTFVGLMVEEEKEKVKNFAQLGAEIT
jgi:hypothetical protein